MKKKDLLTLFGLLLGVMAFLSSFLHPRIFKVTLEEEAEKEIIVSTEPEKK